MASDLFTTCFVSGKGGVGKTTLAVAFAHELSLGTPTLLIDLDFFNRGLSALMPTGEVISKMAAPSFLDPSDHEAPTWCLCRLTDNLYHVQYPDLTDDEMHRFATLPIHELTASLSAFIETAASQCGCTSVVLDCHGGPDNSSFAACLVSDYALLVSEPDKITFYGTLNFVRQMNRVTIHEEELGAEIADPNLYLIFNKVTSVFSGLFLKTLYDRDIKRHFGGRSLLGIFPLELYLTTEFERTPFLTKLYPYSLLAKKTRLLLNALLRHTRPKYLRRTFRKFSNLSSTLTMLTLGKTTVFARPFFPVAVFAALMLAMFVLEINRPSRINEPLRQYAYASLQLELYVAVSQYPERDVLLAPQIGINELLFDDAQTQGTASDTYDRGRRIVYFFLRDEHTAVPLVIDPIDQSDATQEDVFIDNDVATRDLFIQEFTSNSHVSLLLSYFD